MKKLLTIIALFFAVYSLSAQVEPLDTDSNGYRNISTLDHLRWVSENDSSWSWNFELDNDINAGDTKNWNERKGWFPIGNRTTPFSGRFNGHNFEIDSLYIKRENQDYIGFFGSTYRSTILNVGIINCNVAGKSMVGGIVGYSTNTILKYSYVTGKVTGEQNIGGFVGIIWYSYISNSYTNVNVNCTIEHAGGFIGNIWVTNVEYCYSASSVSGKKGISGFVSFGAEPIFTNNFWNSTINDSLTGPDITGISGKTTAQMKTKITFTEANWDFETIWSIDPKTNQGYPYIIANSNSQTNGIEPLDTDGNDYRNISTLDHLRWVSENISSWAWDFELDNDIDAGDTKNWNDGKGWSPIGNATIRFNGIFDGHNFEIDSLFINRPKQDYIGFFGNISTVYYSEGEAVKKYCEIKNIGILNCDIIGNNIVGTLVGKLHNSIIRKSSSTGKVTGSEIVGGLVGNNYARSLICSSYSNTSVLGLSNKVGGLVGENNNSSSISHCYTISSVHGKGKSVGGLIGANSSYSSINFCYANSSVRGESDLVGGLIGINNRSTLNNCYSEGDVISNGKYTGGLIGRNYLTSTVSNCYSITSVSSSDELTGGLIGVNEESAIVRASFWNTETSGQSSSSGGIGKNSKEMQTESTFTEAGWNFDFIWNFDDEYPVIDIDMTYRPKDTDNDGSLNINTIMDLRWLSESGYDLEKKWELGKDIDAKDTKNWNGGAGFNSIGKICGEYTGGFIGEFNGNGYEISGIFINDPNQYGIGLFHRLDNGEIVNLGLANCDITGQHAVACLAGSAGFSKIENCYAWGKVNGNSSTGGIIGISVFSVLKKSFFNGTILCEGRSAGGLVATNSGAEVHNCYSRGSVTGGIYVGGLIGHNAVSSIVTNSYSTSLVKGNRDVGGLMGHNFSSTVTNCFWDKQTSLQATSYAGTGKTTARMKTKSTFTDADWDFENIWSIDPKINQGYPYLEAVPVSVLEEYVRENNNISIYPNPITKGNILNITSDEIMNYSFLDFSIKIYNMEGVLVAKIHNSQNILISNDFSIGTYFLLMESDGKIIGSEKFIVK